MNNISIKPLSKELLNDFFDFFNNEAFCDNPEWAGCYCLYYHFGNDQEWQSRTIADNKKTAGEMIIQGKLKGYLAYMDGKVVGWCNVNDTGSFERLDCYSEIRQDMHGKCCSIVCFIISPQHRGKGIASRLLQDCLNRLAATTQNLAMNTLKHTHGKVRKLMRRNITGLCRCLKKQDLQFIRKSIRVIF